MTWKTPQIETAFAEGKKLGASHMILAMDPVDGESYPIYVKFGEDPQENFPENGDYVDEVYSLTIPWGEQASVGRVWNAEKTAVPVSPVSRLLAYTNALEGMLLNLGLPVGLLKEIKAGFTNG